MAAVIRIDDVSKHYREVKALQQMTMQINKGEIFGIVGPNGAGKTTLIEIVEGLRQADQGEVHILGFNVRTQIRQIKERIGVLLQSTSIPERAKVKEVLALFASFYERSLDVAQIKGMLNLEDKMNAKIKSLSGGWKQRVSLALALINDPEIVFLDEPSMGLDPNARSDMWQMIQQMREAGRTIVLTTHYMEEAQTLCDRIALINHGKLVALDTPEQLIKQLSRGQTVMFDRLPEVKTDELAALPYVVDVFLESGRHRIKLATENLDVTLQHLFRLADQQSWLVRNLKIGEGSMDDVFNQLTIERGEQL